MADEHKDTSQIDPTKNVLDLVEAAVTRIDDLREADRRYYDSKHLHTRELVMLRADYTRELVSLRSEFSANLRDAEAKRIDAIRQVDREAEAKRALELQNTVNTLAANTIGLKDTLQNTVAQTAVALENKQAATQAENNRRLSNLELMFSEGKGKSDVREPASDEIAKLVNVLIAKESVGSGKSSGNAQTVAYLIAGVGVVGTLVAIAISIITVVVLLRR